MRDYEKEANIKNENRTENINIKENLNSSPNLTKTRHYQTRSSQKSHKFQDNPKEMDTSSPSIKVKTKGIDTITRDKNIHKNQTIRLGQNDIKEPIRYKLFQTPSYKAENQGVYNKPKKKKHRMIKIVVHNENNTHKKEINPTQSVKRTKSRLMKNEKHDFLQANKEEAIKMMDEDAFNMFDLKEETYKLKKKKPKEIEQEEEIKRNESNTNEIKNLFQHDSIQHQYQSIIITNTYRRETALANNSPKLLVPLKDENIPFPSGFMDATQIYNLEESFKRTFEQLNLLESGQEDKEWGKEYDVQKKLKTQGRPYLTDGDSESENENRESRRGKSFVDLKLRRRKRLSKMEMEHLYQNSDLESDEGFMEPQIVIQSEFQMQNEYFENMSDEVVFLICEMLIIQFEEEANEENFEQGCLEEIPETQINYRPKRTNNPFIILRDISKEERLMLLNQVQTPMQTELSVAPTDKDEIFDIISDKMQEGA